MLKSKQYGWTLDEHAKGYSCIFVYMRKDTTATQPCAEEEVRIHLDNPNAAIAFQKLLVEAGYKYEPLTQPAKNFKVVINNCFGGFGFSDAAKHELCDAGLDVEERFSRHDPRLVEVVERLGDDANSKYASLKVVDLEGETQYFITEYDGSESVWTPKTAPWKGDA